MTTSILGRFAATLATNAFGAVASFLASLLIARSLGPSVYGDYSFLLASFAALNGWLDLGTSTAFYTFMSKGTHARAHLRVYVAWLAARLLLVGAAVALLPAGIVSAAWVGQPRTLVLTAWAAFFASVVGRVFLVHVAESARRTLFVQPALAVLSLSHLAAVAALRFTGAVSLPAFFYLLVLEYAALGAWFLVRFEAPREEAAPPRPAELVRRYTKFCAPLAGYAFLGFAAEYADRWLLQRFGGSAQQGYFGLGQQFSAVTLLATTSLLNIFWKELADASASANKARMRELYGRSARALFFVAAAGGAFLAPHARILLELTAGPGFADGWPTMAMMLLFPAFQTLGQLNGAFFFATEDTRTHTAIAGAGMLAGLPLAWLVLAPADGAIPGLALGSAGLAARSWILQAAAVSVQCTVVSRRLDGGHGAARHWAVLAGLLVHGWACAAIGRMLVPSAAALVPAGVLYAAGLIAALVRFPGLAGADKAHLDRVLGRFRSNRAP